MKKFLLAIIFVMGCVMLPTTTKAATTYYGCYATKYKTSGGNALVDVFGSTNCVPTVNTNDILAICQKTWSVYGTVGFVMDASEKVCNEKLSREKGLSNGQPYRICRDKNGDATTNCSQTACNAGSTSEEFSTYEDCSIAWANEEKQRAKDRASNTACWCPIPAPGSCAAASGINSELNPVCPSGCELDSKGKCSDYSNTGLTDEQKYNALGWDAASKLNQIGGGSLSGDTAGVSKLISMFVNFLLGILGSIALVLYIYGGFLWMTAAGNSDRVGKGVNIIIWTSLGVVVMLSSYIIVKFIFASIKPTLS